MQEYKLLLKQWRYEELSISVSKLDVSHLDYFQANYYLFQALIIQGKFNEAKEIYKTVIERIDRNSDLYTSFQLRHHVLKIQNSEIVNFYQALEELNEPNTFSQMSSATKALALSLYGRAILMGIGFGLISALEKDKACKLINESAFIYKQAGYAEEYQSELIFLANTYNNKPNPDSNKSFEIYSQVEKGNNIYNSLLHAEAGLKMAEISFDDMFNSSSVSEDKFSAIIRLFESAVINYKAGWHIAPEGIVKQKLGQKLLEYGLENGLKYLVDAANEFHEKSLFAEEQFIYRNMIGWHNEHGNFKEAKIVSLKADVPSGKIDLEISKQVEELEKINDAFITGRIDIARNLHKNLKASFHNTQLQNQFDSLLANSLSQLGLKEESISIFRENVNKLKGLKVSAFLSDAYANLSSALINYNPQEARKFIVLAIKVDEALADTIAKVQHIQQLIQIILQQQSIEKGRVEITPELETCFNESFITLKDNRKHIAAIRLGDALQTKGQAFFRAGRVDEALTFYEQARQVLEPVKVNNGLAFLNCQIAITLLGKARNLGSKEVYANAIANLSKALAYFQIESLNKELFRNEGLLAICQYECGRLHSPKSNDTIELWGLAELHFERSFAYNQFIRKHADDSDPLSEQQSIISVTKETLTYIEQAFYMHLKFTGNEVSMLKWLERLKSQSLLLSLEKADKSNASLETADLIEPEFDLNKNVYRSLEKNILFVEYYYSQTEVVIIGMRNDWSNLKIKTLSFKLDEFETCVQMHFSKEYGNVRSMFRYGMEEQWQRFNFLISPVLEWSIPGEVICFIPYKLFHEVPLHTLKTSEGNYLIERNPVFYNQSLSLLLYLAKRNKIPASLKHEKYIFGNSRGNLEFAEMEAKKVAEILDSSVKLKDKVTKAAVIACLGNARIIHIAGHSELSDDGWRYGLQMANNETLSASDLIGSKCEAELVVLSGCETGISEYNSGDELVGLPRAFIYSGVENLLVSLWKIDDYATMEFFEEFYSNWKAYPEMKKAKLLQCSIISQLKKGRNFFYWGAFQLIAN